MGKVKTTGKVLLPDPKDDLPGIEKANARWMLAGMTVVKAMKKDWSEEEHVAEHHYHYVPMPAQTTLNIDEHTTPVLTFGSTYYTGFSTSTPNPFYTHATTNCTLL